MLDQRSNGWSSNEFESFDDLSDDDAAPPACSNMKVSDAHQLFGVKLMPQLNPSA